MYTYLYLYLCVCANAEMFYDTNPALEAASIISLNSLGIKHKSNRYLKYWVIGYAEINMSSSYLLQLFCPK